MIGLSQTPGNLTKFSKSRILILAVLVAMITVTLPAPAAEANPGFASEFVAAYGGGTGSTFGNAECATCHLAIGNNGQGFNAYGFSINTLVDGGMTFEAAMTAVEALDADGAGGSNLEEITANAQPGWTSGFNPTWNMKGIEGDPEIAPSGILGDLDPGTANVAPSAVVGGPYSGTAGSPVLFDGSGSFDSDGTIVTYAWTFGDGGTSSLESPSYTYGSAGLYDVTLVVTDNDGAISAVSSTTADIAPVPNVAPVARGDAYWIYEGVTLIVPVPGVLGNDTDANGDTLTAVIDTGVSNGTLVLNDDGSFSYTPKDGFTGTDMFAYFANDGIANSNVSAIVAIEVRPAEPEVTISQLRVPKKVGLSERHAERTKRVVVAMDLEGLPVGDPLDVVIELFKDGVLADTADVTLLSGDGTTQVRFEVTLNQADEGIVEWEAVVSAGGTTLTTATATTEVTFRVSRK